MITEAFQPDLIRKRSISENTKSEKKLLHDFSSNRKDIIIEQKSNEPLEGRTYLIESLFDL